MAEPDPDQKHKILAYMAAQDVKGTPVTLRAGGEEETIN